MAPGASVPVGRQTLADSVKCRAEGKACSGESDFGGQGVVLTETDSDWVRGITLKHHLVPSMIKSQPGVALKEYVLSRGGMNTVVCFRNRNSVAQTGVQQKAWKGVRSYGGN